MSLFHAASNAASCTHSQEGYDIIEALEGPVDTKKQSQDPKHDFCVYCGKVCVCVCACVCCSVCAYTCLRVSVREKVCGAYHSVCVHVRSPPALGCSSKHFPPHSLLGTSQALCICVTYFPISSTHNPMIWVRFRLIGWFKPGPVWPRTQKEITRYRTNRNYEVSCVAWRTTQTRVLSY